ncbi:MAG: CHASE2 domain-containing protein [Terriglobales bacterium]
MAFLTKTRKTFVRGAIIAAAVTAAVFIIIANTRPLEWLEAGTYDARVRATAKAGDPDIVIIDIDNASFQIMKDSKGWRWPWSRIVWAKTIDHITPGGPRAIVFDASYGGAQDENGIDDRFAAALKSSGVVVLGYSFTSGEVDSKIPLEERWKALQPESSYTPYGIGYTVDPAKQVLDLPLQKLADSAAGLGSIVGAFDFDGAVRRVPLFSVAGNHAYRALALRAADLAAGNGNADGRLQRGRFQFNPGISLPTDQSGNLLLVWHKNAPAYRDNEYESGSFSYTRIPIWNLFCSMPEFHCPPEVQRYPAEYFRNKIVIVGASAAAAYDAHPTPFGTVAPGMLAHATAIDNLLHGEAIRPAPSWLAVFAILVMAALGSGILIRIQSGWWALLSLAVTIALYVAICFLSFGAAHFWMPMVSPLGVLTVSYVGSGAVRYTTTGRELRRTRGTLDRYVAPQLVDYVLEHINDVNLAGEKRELTIFFSDVRNFTTLTEGTPPMELIALLNEYLAAMTEIIFKYEGIVDKFIGDGILAHWGAFTPGKNHALLAAQASLEMLERLKELNKKWESEGRKQLAIGIGLNTGDVIFGNVGAGKKIEFTVIGDAVNLAARLESLTKEYKTLIIISEFTLAKLGNMAAVEPLGGVKVKGKTVETQIYALQAIVGQSAPESVAVASN